MTDNSPVAWLNGRQVPFADAGVPVWDLGVVAGATVSEMARTYLHAPFRVPQHLQRMTNSCRELGFPLGYSAEELQEVALDLIRINSAAISRSGDLGVVWFATAGTNPTYAAAGSPAEPTVCVHTFDIPFSSWKTAIQSGICLTIPEQNQLPGSDFPVQHKTRNRLHWWLADRAAHAQRPGARALLTDAEDHLTETSAACLYAVRDNCVVSARQGVLRSTTRDFVAELCERAGLAFRLTDLPRAAIKDFQEVFLSSTPCGLLPVTSIDDQTFPGPDGMVLNRLHEEWQQVTGVSTFSQILNHPV